MDKLMKAAASIAAQFFRDFDLRGGVVWDGEKKLSVEQACSYEGALTPILWMLREFVEDYEIAFPALHYSPDQASITGLKLVGIEASRSASPAIFMLADFLRNELAPEEISDLDLSVLFTNFRTWAAENVLNQDGGEMGPQGERRPE